MSSRAVPPPRVVLRARARAAALGVLVTAALLGAGLTAVPALDAPAAAVVEIGDTPSPSWRVNGRVYAVEIVDNRLFVGGSFTTATSPDGQTVTRRNLAAFDVRTGEVRTGWRADASSTVRALASDGRSLFVGGSFGQVAGRTRARLAKVRVDTSAVSRTFSPHFDNDVRALDLDGSHVYAGGSFTHVSGLVRHRVVKMDAATGAVARRFVASPNAPVWAVAKNPVTADVYVSGPFSAVNGASRHGVAALSSRSGRPRHVVFASAARPTLGLDVNGAGSLLFTAGGAGDNAAAAWRTTTGARLWRQPAMGDVQAIDFRGGSVYFGFHEGLGGDTSLRVAAADATTGSIDPDFRPTFTTFWGVFAIDTSDAGLVIGGEFTAVSGVPAEGFARFGPTGR